MKLYWELSLEPSYVNNSIKILLSFRNLLQNIDLQKSDYSHQISMIVDAIEKHLSVTSKVNNVNSWKLTVLALKMLRSHLKCRSIAQGENGDILTERERLTILVEQFQEFLPQAIDSTLKVGQVAHQIVKQDGRSINANKLIEFLQILPLATTYLKQEELSYSLPVEQEENDKPPPAIVRITAFIDSVPLVTPQLLQPQISYSLNFKIRGVSWHDDSERLHLRILSTYPTKDYSVSSFILHKPEKITEYDYEGELNGRIQFTVAQSSFSDNIFFSIECAFELLNGSFYPVPVIGYNQLEFRVLNAGNQLFFSGYTRLDLHVANLIEDLLNYYPSVRSEIQELLPVIEALTCLLGVYAQQAIFKTTTVISESDFQSKVLQDLRFKLGQDVKEHTKQAGGFTDICYRGVIIELKVEKQNGDRQHICKKYTKQSTQYEGIESRQVSIVLVLDLTPKELPPGDIRNDILLVDVPTHGGNDTTKKYPSKAFVFIVNGNIKNPSDYSK